jgi:hypothetical protein
VALMQNRLLEHSYQSQIDRDNGLFVDPQITVDAPS